MPLPSFRKCFSLWFCDVDVTVKFDLKLKSLVSKILQPFLENAFSMIFFLNKKLKKDSPFLAKG